MSATGHSFLKSFFFTSAASAAFGISVLATAGPVQALSYEVLPGGNGIRIKGTGYNLTDPLAPNAETPVSTGVDPNWTIKAFANNAVTSPNLYIPSSLNGFNATPSVWFGGSLNNAAITLPGDTNTYRWATYAAYPNSLLVPIGDPPFGNFTSDSYFQRPLESPVSTAVSQSPYSYIVSTSFTLAKSALYDFTYNATADNRVQIYLGGTVNNADPQVLDITGGTLVDENAANTPGQFTTLVQGTKQYFLTAGTYELNYVVTDNWRVNLNSDPPNPGTFGQTGILIGTTLFTEVPQVPGPLPVLGAAAFFAHSRKLRRRVQKSQSSI